MSCVKIERKERFLSAIFFVLFSTLVASCDNSEPESSPRSESVPQATADSDAPDSSTTEQESTEFTEFLLSTSGPGGTREKYQRKCGITDKRLPSKRTGLTQALGTIDNGWTLVETFKASHEDLVC